MGQFSRGLEAQNLESLQPVEAHLSQSVSMENTINYEIFNIRPSLDGVFLPHPMADRVRHGGVRPIPKCDASLSKIRPTQVRRAVDTRSQAPASSLLVAPTHSSLVDLEPSASGCSAK